MRLVWLILLLAGIGIGVSLLVARRDNWDAIEHCRLISLSEHPPGMREKGQGGTHIVVFAMRYNKDELLDEFRRRKFSIHEHHDRTTGYHNKSGTSFTIWDDDPSNDHFEIVLYKFTDE